MPIGFHPQNRYQVPRLYRVPMFYWTLRFLLLNFIPKVLGIL